MQRLGRLLAARGAHPARTVVLVPYAQLMPLARQFWSRHAPSGFTPRFETTMNWARQSAFAPGPLDLAFDMGRDLLAAREWLERAGLRRDADLLAPRLVEAAWQAAESTRAVAPASRAAWAARLRPALLHGLEGAPLAYEAAVARIAFEWAAASAYASDALLDGRLTVQLDALVVLQGLRPDPLAQALLAQLGDTAEAWPLAQEAPPGDVALQAARDAADEAGRAAACILRHVQAGRAPVAVAATDRLLTRRIGALLASRGVAVRDETGWKLSTTRAAAHVMGVLRGCAWDASCDQVLDWLKVAPACPRGVVQGVERCVRRAGVREWRMLRDADWGESAALRDAVRQVAGWREALAAPRPLPAWLDDLRAVLDGCGHWSVLVEDAAGAKLVEVLRLQQHAGADLQAFAHAGRPLDLRDFTAWANEVIEATGFVPPSGGDEPVVVLPMQQVLGHGFAALVLPGCDERNLPAAPEPPPEWTEAQRTLLGLPGRDELLQAQSRAWEGALQAPHCDVLWRASDDSGEHLLPSPLVQRLQLAGVGREAADARAARAVRLQGVLPPQPVAAQLVPAKLSASSWDDLRKCPYRFFALRMLGLREAQELEAEVDKSDFGNWLHSVLRRFHDAQKAQPAASLAQRRAALDAAAEEATAQLRLAPGEFLPFAAGWPRVREGYLAWLLGDEETGVAYDRGEAEVRGSAGATLLEGRIDRIDRLPGGGVRVMDYKTESLQGTQARMQQPLEDTQLAFYALLLAEERIEAAYLNVSERGEVREVPHPDVAQAAHVLEEGIVTELRRIAQGAALPALGEGKVCGYCAARGLCRKDSWA